MQPSGSNELCASSKVSAGCCGSQAATSSVQTMAASCRCAHQRRPAGSGAAAELRRAQRACWGGRELRPARGTAVARVGCASSEESVGHPTQVKTNPAHLLTARANVSVGGTPGAIYLTINKITFTECLYLFFYEQGTGSRRVTINSVLNLKRKDILHLSAVPCFQHNLLIRKKSIN